ncbi:putative serine protease HhoA precursor [Novipirellula aureliae]|uniref:Putative serine protease HhoA n=1 Tax=Novipirellula aureliae TaxID=2527966 RepID=A0A5C6DNI7_9BACT|nr:trypsin-like peptidase domain-containing protein [Novipirellula aureliae]TWU38853.1 putative serine protease HhoA precursor [Novipirellula aureliae]
MQIFRNVWVLFLGLSIIVTSQTTARCDDFDFESLQSDILKTIDQVRPAVVRISGGSAFSGVIVSADGHVLSAAHAITPGKRYQITLPDGRRFRGVGKGTNSKADCALVKILDPGDDLPYAPMGDSSSLVPNQPCVGLSYPGGQRAGSEPVVRFGRFISISRSRGMLQTSVLMEPGDSGGPVFDLNGCVIGIRSRIGRSMDQNYEVPVDVYREFWSELNREKSFIRSGSDALEQGVRYAAVRQRRGNGEGNGLAILSVSDGSLASKAGLNRNDIILRVYGRRLQSMSDLREALEEAWDDGVESIKVQVKRSNESLDLEIDFGEASEVAPKVALPENDRPAVPAPQGFRELNGLAGQLADLESKLDDACITITSEFGEDESRTITGTRIRGTRWVVSKDSVVGQNPTAEVDGDSFPLNIVERDTENDLVLLEAPDVQSVGIDLDAVISETFVGTFLLTPDDDGAGLVSVVGSSTFRSQKESRRAVLGVVPSTYEDNQGAHLDEVNDDGAAKRAGLLVGDVVTKMDDTIIRTQNDMRRFLSQVGPDAVVMTTLRRDDEELTKRVKLESNSSRASHVADRMDKSSRRVGFREVFPHDADLKPSDCGGPLFDLTGEFVGLNIARYSRVRSFALPASELKEFVQQAASKASSTNE